MKSCPIRWGSVIESRTRTGHAAVVGAGVDATGVAVGDAPGETTAVAGADAGGADGPGADVAAEIGDAETDDAGTPGGETAGTVGGAPRQPAQAIATTTASILACRLVPPPRSAMRLPPSRQP
jgi:hypothetical protein